MIDHLSPIVIFVYNRPWHTQQTIEALQNNELAKESELFIYSDGPKNIDVEKSVIDVRTYINNINGFKKVTIIKRDKNWGLSRSIINGVTDIVKRYGKIIVLEDDLVTSPYFLQYMNNGLNIYRDKDKVASIHGYVYPIKKKLPNSFFIRGADCWGWATWERAWNVFENNGDKLLNKLQLRGLEKEVDFNGSYQFVKMLKNQIKGKNDSWAVRWYISTFLSDMLTLYPGKSYIQNIGNDNSGIHCSSTDVFKVELISKYFLEQIKIEEDKDSRDLFEKYFNSIKLRIDQKIFNKIKYYMKGIYAK